MAYTGGVSRSWRRRIAAAIIVILTLVTSFIFGGIMLSYSPTLGLVINGSIYVNGSGEINGAVTMDDLFIDLNTTFMNCTVEQVGHIYYNNVTQRHYGCNASGWNALY